MQWTLTVLIVTFCLGFAFALRERVVLPLQTLSNLLAALGEARPAQQSSAFDGGLRCHGATVIGARCARIG